MIDKLPVREMLVQWADKACLRDQNLANAVGLRLVKQSAGL